MQTIWTKLWKIRINILQQKHEEVRKILLFIHLYIFVWFFLYTQTITRKHPLPPKQTLTQTIQRCTKTLLLIQSEIDDKLKKADCVHIWNGKCHGNNDTLKSVMIQCWCDEKHYLGQPHTAPTSMFGLSGKNLPIQTETCFPLDTRFRVCARVCVCVVLPSRANGHSLQASLISFFIDIHVCDKNKITEKKRYWTTKKIRRKMRRRKEWQDTFNSHTHY